MSSMTEPKTREWLLLNAVEAWLHNYQHVNTSTFTQYTELRDELYDVYMASLEQPEEPKPTRKRKSNAKTTTAETV